MAPSLRSLLNLASNFVAQLPLSFKGPQPLPDVVPYIPLSGAPSCPLDGPTSCLNSTPVAGDSCCFVYPGGRILLTQFWDQQVHAGGAEEDWTLHGLWFVLDRFPLFNIGITESNKALRDRCRPDHCDGSFDQFCRLTPEFHNITEVLGHYGQDELLEFMDRYWLAAS